jgi:competence ComEA-like helix-hairpin-helix protein
MDPGMPHWKALGLVLAAFCCSAAQSADEDAKTLPEGPGRTVTAKVCLNCHESTAFRKARMDRDEWEREVGIMVDNGAKATDAELQTIVDYLVENFGPKSKIHVNTAPVGEIKSVLGLTAAQAVAIVDYREAKGPFKTVADLLKVPQIDARKIEDHKDLLAF